MVSPHPFSMGFGVALLVLFCSTSTAGVFSSSDLGWKAGEDVTEALTELLRTGKLKAGDELKLDHTYRISGSHELPDDFTLSATQGAGFEVTDTTSNRGPFLILGDKNTLRNVTINYLDAPKLGPKGTNPQHETDFARKTGIQASAKSDLLFENCRLIGSLGSHVKLDNKCSRPRFIGCHIRGGFWTIRLSANDAVFKRCVIEQYQGDGIKTAWAKRPIVENCIFQDGGRDGIDTTGGWDESVVRDTVFRRLGVSGLDLKSSYIGKGDLDSPENVGILIEKCRFVDTPNAVVLTLTDRGPREDGEFYLTAEMAEEYAPHDIDINDCVIGRTQQAGDWTAVKYPGEMGEKMRLLLVKGGHSIRYRNARFFGDDIMVVRFTNLGGTRHLSKEVGDRLNYGVTGTVAGPTQPDHHGDVSVPFAYGPQAQK